MPVTNIFTALYGKHYTDKSHACKTKKNQTYIQRYLNPSHIYKKKMTSNSIQACANFLKISLPMPVISSRVEIQMMAKQVQKITKL